MKKEYCVEIAELLKFCDYIHMSYYEYHDRLEKKSMPKILIGGEYLKIIINGDVCSSLSLLKNRIKTFLIFFDSIRKNNVSTEKDKERCGSYVKKFNSMFDDVYEKIKCEKNVLLDKNSKNVVMMNYFI